MSLQEWLTEFRVLHDKARSGTLSDYDAKLYKDGREELAAALVQAQRLTRKPEESAREALRVARAVQVDLELNSGKQRVARSTSASAASPPCWACLPRPTRP